MHVKCIAQGGVKTCSHHTGDLLLFLELYPTVFISVAMLDQDMWSDFVSRKIKTCLTVNKHVATRDCRALAELLRVTCIFQ